MHVHLRWNGWCDVGCNVSNCAAGDDEHDDDGDDDDGDDDDGSMCEWAEALEVSWRLILVSNISRSGVLSWKELSSSEECAAWKLKQKYLF